jgi:hypothetical protein
MPVRKVQGGYRWGQSGKVYPTKSQAERQGRAIHASGYQDGGIVDVSQGDDPYKKYYPSPIARAAIQGQQRNPGQTWLTPARAAWFVANFSPIEGIKDVLGLSRGVPEEGATLGEFRTGDQFPGMTENIREGRYIDAALQGLGGAGDVAMWTAPFTGPVGLGVGLGLKSLSGAAKTARASRAADEVADTGIAALQNQRAADAAARQLQAQTSSTRRLGTTGQYVGAPQGVTSPQALGRLRSNYIDMVRAGEAGADWYSDASRWARSVTNSDEEAQQLVDLLALTSASTDVGSNLGFTVKALNQAAAGAPIRTGRFPTRQSRVSGEILGGSRENLGPKITPFADNLTVAWNPRMASQPVHDIWQGRAMGYKDVSVKSYPTRKEALNSITNKKGEVSAAAKVIKDGDVYRIERPWSAGFSEAQHAFMDREMATIVDMLNEGKVAGKTDWTPAEAQAAAWTGAKIRAGELNPEDAAKHYGSFASRYTAHATTEQVPGVGTGHLEGLLGLTRAEREAFSFDPRSSWTDEAGRDELYSSTGIPVEPSLENVGSYRTVAGGELETNPGVVARPLVQTEASGPRTGQLIPESRTVLEKVESARAYFDVQNAGAAHRVIPDSQTRAGERISLDVPLDRKLTQEEMVALDEVAQNNGMFVVDSGEGVRMINDPYTEIGARRAEAASSTDTTSRAEAARNLNKERKGVGGLYDQIINSIDEPADSIRVVPTKIETVYEDYQGRWSQGVGSGASTRKILDDMDEVPEIRDAMEPPLKRKAQQNLVRDQEMAESSGLAVRPDVQEARRIFIAEGWAGLRKALNNGAILPAVAAAVVAPSVLIERNESPQM